jgi:hypothetical protein
MALLFGCVDEEEGIDEDGLYLLQWILFLASHETGRWYPSFVVIARVNKEMNRYISTKSMVA